LGSLNEQRGQKQLKTRSKTSDFPSLSLNGDLLRRAAETIDSLDFLRSEKDCTRFWIEPGRNGMNLLKPNVQVLMSLRTAMSQPKLKFCSTCKEEIKRSVEKICFNASCCPSTICNRCRCISLYNPQTEEGLEYVMKIDKGPHNEQWKRGMLPKMGPRFWGSGSDSDAEDSYYDMRDKWLGRR
jgi:hypothetical protein